jgi:hypothetical protein
MSHGTGKAPELVLICKSNQGGLVHPGMGGVGSSKSVAMEIDSDPSLQLYKQAFRKQG